MIHEVIYWTLWCAIAFFTCYGWARWMERLAEPVCSCRKGAWDPSCPIHGKPSPSDEGKPAEGKVF